MRKFIGARNRDFQSQFPFFCWTKANTDIRESPRTALVELTFLFMDACDFMCTRFSQHARAHTTRVVVISIKHGMLDRFHSERGLLMIAREPSLLPLDVSPVSLWESNKPARVLFRMNTQWFQKILRGKSFLSEVRRAANICRIYNNFTTCNLFSFLFSEKTWANAKAIGTNGHGRIFSLWKKKHFREKRRENTNTKGAK